MFLRHRSRSKELRGQALVEFAVIVPLLVLLLVGVIQLGVTLGGNVGLINSVREAARYGSVCTGGPAACGPIVATYSVSKISSAAFGLGGTPTATVEYQAYQDSSTAPAKWNVRIRVSGCAASVIFMPVIGYLISPGSPNSLPLKRVETFRVEGSPSVAAQAGIAAEPAWTVRGGGGC